MPGTQSPWRNMRTKGVAGTSVRRKNYIGRSNLPGDQFYDAAVTVGRNNKRKTAAGGGVSPIKWNN